MTCSIKVLAEISGTEVGVDVDVGMLASKISQSSPAMTPRWP